MPNNQAIHLFPYNGEKQPPRRPDERVTVWYDWLYENGAPEGPIKVSARVVVLNDIRWWRYEAEWSPLPQ